MGKDIKGKEIGVGIFQQKDGVYCARFVDRYGRRKCKRSKKLQEVRKWLADSTFTDKHSDLDHAEDMLVEAWFQYWIGIKKQTVRANTARNYAERYERNIKDIIGNKLLSEVKPIDCQKIFLKMAEEGYRTSTIAQVRLSLYNMLEFAKENDVILINPCKKSVKSNMGQPSAKREALTIGNQKKFLETIFGYSYENQYRFVLQTGLRAGELIGLRWSDIDFDERTIKIQRSMEFRYSTKEWMTGPPKSKAGLRTIPLTDEAIRILKNQKAKNRQINPMPLEWSETVFLCREGTPVKNSTYDTALFKYCDKAGIPRISMHILRHTFATRCIEAGMKPKTLQTIMGHSNISITMNLYVHMTDDEKKKEMEMVAEALKIV